MKAHLPVALQFENVPGNLDFLTTQCDRSTPNSNCAQTGNSFGVLRQQAAALILPGLRHTRQQFLRDLRTIGSRRNLDQRFPNIWKSVYVRTNTIKGISGMPRNAALLLPLVGGKGMSSYFCNDMELQSDVVHRQLSSLQPRENQSHGQHAKRAGDNDAARADACRGGTGQCESG